MYTIAVHFHVYFHKKHQMIGAAVETGGGDQNVGQNSPRANDTQTHQLTKGQAVEMNLDVGWGLRSRRDVTPAAKHSTQSDASKKRTVTPEL